MEAIEYVAPRSVAEAAAVLSARGDRARMLAGGTDIIVQLREGRRSADVVVDVKHIPELSRLEWRPGKELLIGAAVPCCRIYEDAAIAGAFPGLIDAAALIGGIQIQSRASLGGNLCNASPAADSIPALIAHSAVCVIGGAKAAREVPAEKFCVAPGRTCLERGELLVSLRLPAPPAGFGAAYLRFIPRNEMDIAVVGVGASVTLDAGKSRCTAARIALAAVAPTPLLVAQAGAALVGTAPDDAAIGKAAAAAQAACSPISDMRGTADYRRHLVGVLVKRALQQAIKRAKEK
jgi:carbon-monoxide dehydrogenase medium subunit